VTGFTLRRSVGEESNSGIGKGTRLHLKIRRSLRTKQREVNSAISQWDLCLNCGVSGQAAYGVYFKGTMDQRVGESSVDNNFDIPLPGCQYVVLKSAGTGR
jgi:hypothetical protein